jgi:hypothetical protein
MNPSITLWLFGHTIELIMEKLENLLSVPNERDEAYPLRGWPIIAPEDTDAYRM